jgi:exopolyphosphatase/guanosine-5'-triphosphate,3'-diphosphate pyrophosphatase
VKCLHAHLAWYLAGGGDPVGRWVTHQLTGQIEGPVAAIDCGTNSTRLLVVDRAGGTLDRQTRITRLGEGVDRTGRLSVPAIGRTVSVLAEYRMLMDRFGVVRCRATATSAARDAANADELFGAAERVLGTPLELLGGAEEGRLSYRGATMGLDERDGPYLVVDLGGGSTELAVGPPPGGAAESSVAAVSLDVGCVRVTERFLSSDPPAPSEIADAVAYVRGLVDGAVEHEPRIRLAPRMVGVAGTVSTLAMLDLGLETHVRDQIHHAVMSRDRIVALAGALLGETGAARAARPGVEPGRADVIAGGALVLAEVMARTGHDELIASESDILDGVAAELRDQG